MLKHHTLPRVDHPAETVNEDAVLRFDADSAVRAMVFHLLDERLARVVSTETIRRTIERLRSKSFAPSIARRQWAMMTNGQRLKWFLNESQTITVVGENNIVVLRARRSR